MSQQADGLKASDMQNTEEKELGMQCHKPHEKTKSYAFLSSKSTSSSNNKTIHHQYSLIDDDLGTWLQYPFDDDVACHDMFQHWPSSSPSPALPSLHFPPSPILKGSLPQQNEGLMVDLASDEPLEICESLVSVKNDQKPITLLNQASCSEGSILQEALKQRVGEVRQLDPLVRHGNEVASPVLGAVNMQQVGGSEIRGVSKDFKKLSQSKLLSQEDASGWAVANEAPNAGTHNKHMDKRTVGGGEDWDKKSAHTARLRQPPRHAGLPHLNVAGSSSDHGPVNKNSVNSSYREDPSQMEKDVSRKLSAATTTAQAMMSAPACPTADAALALGAGRAAGVIKPLGVEAFSKVRTSLQPARPSKLGSPPLAWAPSPTSAGQYTSYPTGYPPSSRGTASGFHDYALSTQLFQQTLHNAAQPYFFRPCVNFSDVASQGHQSMHPQIGDIDSSSNSFCSVSSTMVLPGFRGKEEVSVGSEQVPCGEQAKFVDADGTVAATFGMDTPEMQRPSGFSLPYRDRKDDVVFSGGSETSESLKETFSGSKRKLDDSECQSEDAEGESTVNSQSRSSNMKRTRANEVHNLSERRRRNRINDKMNALRDLIPNATKSNKAALLDEAIDYLKNLQLQLQVMSMRTGVSLPPMVLPATLPHMQMPIHPVGIGMTGGSSLEMGFGGAGSTVGIAMCDMTYGLPAGSLTNLTSPNSMVLQPPANNAEPRVMRAHEVASSQFSHPFVHAPSQPPFPVNMDVYNNFLQHQQLQHHLPHQEQVALLQVQPSSQQPSSSQEAQYGI